MLIGLGATSFLGFRHVATLSDNMVDNNVAPMKEIAKIQQTWRKSISTS